jgi:hypothetical protein
MSGKRDPWGHIARRVFAKDEHGNPIPYDPAEVAKLGHQIDVGHAKTGGRKHAGRHDERALLVKHFGREKVLKEKLTKTFLGECSIVLEAAGYRQRTQNAMRLMMLELREPRPAARPFHEPDPAASDVDPSDM